ncbi:carboxyl transferase domain-containing protein [Nocardioides albus]|uniref:Acetyl-coenzyme A carboxylase carboxyl transferase subunits beta/alpha n=1 Tax=Nocardioides albus TaxID=1841 RepID=A0A7W5A705_9ACTN|nr:carboxyl transferase domain-containing protein [Nocardioides albus]MBB3090574.1 acetyl-CoA carboxylase carboxyl transferase subunit beta [Nocardioides albus]GGU24873.1 acetyl-CoA carboxylase [Nocardioides albus]
MGLTSAELIDLVLDPDTWTSWDTPPVHGELPEAYAADLARARERAGTDESVVTGEARIAGRRVAVVLSEFRFLAGSIGRASADRLIAAVERATQEGLPLLAGPASGGTRMQEGTPAFVQMVRIAEAVTRHKAAGLPYLVYLRHPTTGGVMASWGSLGHVTVAEPEALLGFLGPKVYEVLNGRPFPSGVQVAENLFAHGLVDGVVPPGELAGLVDRVLGILSLRPAEASGTSAEASRTSAEASASDASADGSDASAGAGDASAGAGDFSAIDTWNAITRSRRTDRPGARALLRIAASDVVPLNGTGQGERDPGLIIALARFGTAPCLVLAQDRREQAHQPLGPEGLREAQRGMKLATGLGLPVVTVIDTPGAALSPEAENGGIAGEIARTLGALVNVEAPTLSLMLGEGNGGGALAFLPADRVVAAQHAWLSPLPPEGASAIVYGDSDHAAEMAEAQRVLAVDLQQIGVVDRIVAETPDAADEPETFCRRVGTVLEDELLALLAAGPGAPAARAARYAG